MALITSTAELKQYISIDANAKIDTYTPFINEAEQLYIIDLIGQSFYDELAAAYAASKAQAPTPLTPENAALLPSLQNCIAYYTQLQSINHITVSFGDMGIRTHRGEDSDPAARWQIEKLQFQALKNGDLYADRLLKFLETNASNSKYATWFNSDYNTKMSGTLLYSSELASQYIEINNSRRIFLKLRNQIRQIETRIIPKLISQEHYAALIAEIKAGPISGPNSALLDKLRPVIAKMALYGQLPFMRVGITEDGLWLYSGVDELRTKDFLASKDDIDNLRYELKDGQFGYCKDEEELRQFIINNIADYPLIQASPVYTVQPVPGPTWTPLNDRNSKHFSV